MWRRINGFAQEPRLADAGCIARGMPGDARPPGRPPRHAHDQRERILPRPPAWQGLGRRIGGQLEPGRGFRAWSAGCSVGMEPYSMAMLAAEIAPAARLRIIASDIDGTALDVGRAGIPRRRPGAGLSPARVNRFHRCRAGRIGRSVPSCGHDQLPAARPARRAAAGASSTCRVPERGDLLHRGGESGRPRAPRRGTQARRAAVRRVRPRRSCGPNGSGSSPMARGSTSGQAWHQPVSATRGTPGGGWPNRSRRPPGHCGGSGRPATPTRRAGRRSRGSEFVAVVEGDHPPFPVAEHGHFLHERLSSSATGPRVGSIRRHSRPESSRGPRRVA